MGTVYSQLSITERRRIERWRHANVPVDEMARVLKRCRSTIFRELKRNHFSDESMPKHDGCCGAARPAVDGGYPQRGLRRCTIFNDLDLRLAVQISVYFAKMENA
jgi:IS30 family transposase